MFRPVLLLVCIAHVSWASEADAPLSREEMAAAIEVEDCSFPMPGELFSALGKTSGLDWSKSLRKTPPGVFILRQQIALNLGALVADGYVAVEARDKAQVRRVAQDIKRMAKGLGVEDELLGRGNSIIEFSEAGQWETLKEEMEATQNEVVAAMRSHKDQDMVTLVMLGGWLRGLEVVSGAIAAKYSEDGGKVLRQPGVVGHFITRTAGMSEKVKDHDLIKAVRNALFEIQKAVTFPAEKIPSLEDVQKIHTLAGDLVKQISTKK